MGIIECGCHVIPNAAGGVEIVYCPLHKAAPQLHKALKEITELAPRDKLRLPYAIQVVEIAEKALALKEAKNGTG